MKVKSVSDCLNIIDFAIVENNIGSPDLENLHENLLEKRESDFIEHRLALSNVLRQITSMIENRFQFADIKSEYVQLRELTLNWFIECNAEPEVDN